MATNKEKKENSTQFEIEFYERILKEQPNFIEVLKVLAELYTKNGMYKEGLKLDKRLAGLLPNDAIVNYNLACSYSLLSDLDESFRALKKAINLGYNDFIHMNKDPDLANLRKDKRFEEIISKNIGSNISDQSG